MHAGMPGQDATPGLDGLEPVMSAEEAQRLKTEWDQLQIRFVEDPRAAVTEARRLVHGTMDRLTEKLRTRARVLEDGMSGEQGDASTEAMRLAMKGYRGLLDQLVSFGKPPHQGSPGRAAPGL